MVLNFIRKFRRPREEPVVVTLPPRPPPRVPDGTRVYAIGDIHGRLDLLLQLHAMILEDAADFGGRKVAVYLGDYVDRGGDSKGVVDLLTEQPLPGFERIHLRGNHEAWLLEFLEDVTVGAAWMFNGGTATLLSYGIGRADAANIQERLLATQALLRQRLPAAHRAFYESLVLSHDEGDYFFVHAGVKPGVPLSLQVADDMLWIRDDFLASDADFGKTVVHGHTVTPEPEFRENRIGIDTGAFGSGHLTCLVLEADFQRLLFT